MRDARPADQMTSGGKDARCWAPVAWSPHRRASRRVCCRRCRATGCAAELQCVLRARVAWSRHGCVRPPPRSTTAAAAPSSGRDSHWQWTSSRCSTRVRIDPPFHFLAGGPANSCKAAALQNLATAKKSGILTFFCDFRRPPLPPLPEGVLNQDSGDMRI